MCVIHVLQPYWSASLGFLASIYNRQQLWLSLLVVQPTSQSQETGALPVIRAATDPTLEGQGFKYLGPFYKGPINANVGNEGQTHAVGLWQHITRALLQACFHRVSVPIKFGKKARATLFNKELMLGVVFA